LFAVLEQLPTQPIQPYTADANTILLDHMDGDIAGERIAYAPTGCNSPFTPVTPVYAYEQGKVGTYALHHFTNNANGPTTIKYNGDIACTSNGTIELWVNPSTYPTDLAYQTPAPNSCSGWIFQFRINQDGQLLGYIWGGVDNFNSGAVKVPLNQWSHVAFSWGANGSYLYINGEQVAIDASTNGPQLGWGTDLWIFSSNALLDELRVSNIQRTQFTIN